MVLRPLMGRRGRSIPFPAMDLSAHSGKLQESCSVASGPAGRWLRRGLREPICSSAEIVSHASFMPRSKGRCLQDGRILACRTGRPPVYTWLRRVSRPCAPANFWGCPSERWRIISQPHGRDLGQETELPRWHLRCSKALFDRFSRQDGATN